MADLLVGSANAFGESVEGKPTVLSLMSRIIGFLRAINGLGSMTWYNEQIIRLGAGQESDPEMRFLPAFISMQKRDKRMAQALKRGQ